MHIVRNRALFVGCIAAGLLISAAVGGCGSKDPEGAQAPPPSAPGAGGKPAKMMAAPGTIGGAAPGGAPRPMAAPPLDSPQ